MAGSPSHLTIDLEAYAHNLDFVRERLPESTGILAVVKANAYGHGIEQIARSAVDHGCTMLGVAHIDEAVTLREAGIDAPILVLVEPSIDDLSLIVRHKLKLVVSSVRIAERLGDLARRGKYVAAIHCAIDTGMGREGFNTEEAVHSLLQITRISNVDIEGIMTHFPSAEISEDPFTENQIKLFRQLLKQLDNEGIPYEMVHAANSPGIINHPDGAFDMVRAGLMTYGVWPTDAPPPNSPLKPVLSWTSRIALLRDIPGGAGISYQRTYRTPSPMRAAVVPVGYGDGYPFTLSGHADVLIRGRRCPVRGRITMNETVVDVTGVPDAAPEDPVTIIGTDGNETITVEDLAEQAGTIPYEILTRLGANLERRYLNRSD